MKPEEMLAKRSGNTCELCSGTEGLKPFEAQRQPGSIVDHLLLVCDTCRKQIEKKEELDSNHWQCLTTSMWSEVPAVQVVSWRMLNRLKSESWAADALDMMYLDDDTIEWAKVTGDHDSAAGDIHRDCNGKILQDGDTVVTIKSLDVKGSTINAKVGTVVKNIRLVPDNVEQIEGKIEGQTIVILTKYLRKQGV